jgi:protein TonB
MSNVSIFEKSWIDLVFEGKNQKYGAYQLRQESPRTTAIAFIFGLLFLILFSGIIFALSSFGEKPVVKIDDDGPIIVCNYPAPNLQIENVEIPVEKIKDKVKSKDLINPVIVEKELAVDEIKTNEEMKKNPSTNGEGVTGGNGISSTGTIVENNGTGNKTEITPKIPDNTVIVSALLDKQPSFPNGMDGFYKYVANNFQRPELDEPQTIRVIVSFVIEKDGSMTNISVLQNPGFGMDKEAIRVLKALKTKWNPGIKDNQPMRTQFTLPITLKTE